MVGPTTVDFLMGNRWSLPPQSQFYLLLVGANVFIMGFILAEEEDPQPFIIAISVAILLLLLFWWLGWFYAAAAVMVPLTGVLWWLERRSKATGALERRSDEKILTKAIRFIALALIFVPVILALVSPSFLLWYRDVQGPLFAPLIAAFLLALPRTTLERGVWSPPSQATFVGLAGTVLCWVLRLPLLAIGIALLYAPFLATWMRRERRVRR